MIRELPQGPGRRTGGISPQNKFGFSLLPLCSCSCSASAKRHLRPKSSNEERQAGQAEAGTGKSGIKPELERGWGPWPVTYKPILKGIFKVKTVIKYVQCLVDKLWCQIPPAMCVLETYLTKTSCPQFLLRAEHAEMTLKVH